MKPGKLDLFKSTVQKRLQKFTSTAMLVDKDDAEKLEIISSFYKVNQQPLNFLLEDTQVDNPVTNTIFLIHQLDVLVNNYFGVSKEPEIA